MTFARYRHSPLGTAWKIAKGRLGAAPVPLAVNLVLTYRCNLRCSYCEVWREPPDEMDTDTVCRLIDEMADAGTERLGLGGGEPMLRKDVGIIIDHAKARGLTVNMVSNGLQVPARVHELAGLDFLAVSLDGPEDVHDAARGKGSHEKAVAAIRAARGAGIEAWTTTVLTRANLGCIPDILDHAKRLGARASFLPVMEEGLKSRNAPALKPAREEFAAAMDLLIAERSRAGTPLAVSADLLRFYRDRWGGAHAVSRRGAWQGGDLACQAGRLFCSIAPDGRIYACNYLQGDESGRSAVALGFAEALRRTAAPDCGGCWCDSFTESNLIFNLRPGAVLHAIRLLTSPPPAMDAS
jgi:MoaA/NifB/PqqE/SkfB family radical SAM enzyme